MWRKSEIPAWSGKDGIACGMWRKSEMHAWNGKDGIACGVERTALLVECGGKVKCMREVERTALLVEQTSCFRQWGFFISCLSIMADAQSTACGGQTFSLDFTVLTPFISRHQMK